jgi:hypothetical protein
MTLDEARAHIGAGVVSREPDNPGHGRPEDGEIVRVSDLYVFVLFVGDRTPKATPPGALTLLAPHQNESLF